MMVLMNISKFEQSRLAIGSGQMWRAGTTGEFLSAIRENRLPQDAFERWLVQDYLFVQGLTQFMALLISKTPRPAQKTLICGLVAFDSELDWFESHLSQRQLDLQAAPHKTCKRYVDYLIQIGHTESFEILLAAIYGVEVSYLCAWNALNATGPYAEFITRWTTPEFASYVRELLDLCDAHPHVEQQRVFDEVMRHERDFWQMTWGD
jgi:formylaminopyrimidine deformylase / aminopyrimidine aminohydrolase